MFFDYPCDEEVLDNLKQKTCATTLHYMNYQNYKTDEEGLLKAFASMIRYSCNNLEGKFILTRGASALGISEEVVEILLEIFQDAGMINIKTREQDFYHIYLKSEISLADTLHVQKYSEFVELMNTINDYKNKFMSIDI